MTHKCTKPICSWLSYRKDAQLRRTFFTKNWFAIYSQS